MSCFAVIDTNVIVSALISKNPESPTRQVFKAMFSGTMVPLYSDAILYEYEEVLKRQKFHLKAETIQTVMNAIRQFGLEMVPYPSGEILVDMDDLVFYEVALAKRQNNAYLVTGNLKHYPSRDFIITPAKMLDIMNDNQDRH